MYVWNQQGHSTIDRLCQTVPDKENTFIKPSQILATDIKTHEIQQEHFHFDESALIVENNIIYNIIWRH